ncbi:MAG TPA: thioesterase family protein [Chitinophagales bacterium]
MYKYEYKHRAIYADTDQMGVVYYGNYARYFEIGRTEALRALGIVYSELEKSGIIMPVTRMNIKYLRPVLYDEMISIITIVKEFPNRIIVFHHELQNEKGEKLCEGEVHLAFVDSKTKKVKQTPALIQEKLKTFFS